MYVYKQISYKSVHTKTNLKTILIHNERSFDNICTFVKYYTKCLTIPVVSARLLYIFVI